MLYLYSTTYLSNDDISITSCRGRAISLLNVIDVAAKPYSATPRYIAI